MTKQDECSHPPSRLYSWYALHLGGRILCIACCECGKPLKGYDGDEKVHVTDTIGPE